MGVISSEKFTRTLKSLANRRVVAVFFLGFASGLPLALAGGTLQAWMAVEGVDLKTIGFFSLVGLPYALKFFWAPLLDRYALPFLGRRRGWILGTQLVLMILIVLNGKIFGIVPFQEHFGFPLRRVFLCVIFAKFLLVWDRQAI